MAITAAADKTTAAFFMGFPFTKIKRQAKAFCRLNPATLCPLLVPSRGTQQENREPEICSGQIRNSELYVRIRKKDLAPIAQEAGDDEQFEIKHLGLHDQWAVLNKSTGRVLAKDLKNRDACKTYINSLRPQVIGR
jgi:hypothetical protein